MGGSSIITLLLCAPVETTSQLNMLYPKGGYPAIIHNEIRDFTAYLLSEVCHNVAIEPHLQPLQGEPFQGSSSNTHNGARLDVAADGLGGSQFELMLECLTQIPH